MTLEEKVKGGQMEVFVGTKTIKAVSTTKKEYCEYRGWNLPDDEDPNEEIMLVEYEVDPESKINHENHDGYVTMSPQYVFDKAYNRNGSLDFGAALISLKDGKKIARSGWNGKDMFLFHNDGRRNGIGRRAIEEGHIREVLDVAPFIVMKTATGELVPWLASQTDMLSEDWKVLD